MKISISILKITIAGAVILGGILRPNPAAADVLTLDASAPSPVASAAGFHLGTTTAPGGHTLTVDSTGLLRDGQRWLPISGEFHFARCPEAEWRDELLKMKAGGLSVVQTYIFWIHHEEVQGVWDWTGQRNLRKFLETCHEVGLDVLLRIGPWCHGEVRNGGFPDWLQKMGDDKVFPLRRDNPGYLGYVQKLYEQVSMQTKGLLWKDGGPVIGIQVENEFSGPTEHLMTLKKMACAAGIDVPIYTVTGWGSGGQAPYGELLPFSGSYADGFWDRSIKPAVYGNAFRFSGSRRGSAAAMGALGATATNTLAPEPARPGTYPFFTCELGAGMMPSYHRRVLMYPADTESLILTRLGSGVNLLGLYMYHGGENPDGKLTYLNETQATRYWNDLPVKNYDFQSPLGEFGQEREHYHWLRQLGMFLQDFGPQLSDMSSKMPGGRGGLNWAMRSDGTHGYIFVSQYQRLSPQRAQTNVQFQIKLAGGDVTMPTDPVSIPDDCRFIWPVNLDLGGVMLISASAQPICHVDDGNTRYTVFKQTARAPAEFVFDGVSATVDSSTGKQTAVGSRILLREVQPGLGAAIRLHGRDGRKHVIILLDEATALDLWKGTWQGQERLFLTHAEFLLDVATLRLRAENSADFSLGILPAPAKVAAGGIALPGRDDGLFRRFTPQLAPVAPLSAVLQPVQPAGPARVIPIAPSIPERRQGMAMQPEDAAFAEAAVWRVKLPPGVDPSRDLLLRVRYTGDVIRAYSGDKLLTDDFYAARPFDIGLRRFGPGVYKDGLTLKILPLREDAPIYITDRSQLKFDDNHTALSLDRVDVIETREVQLEAPNPGAQGTNSPIHYPQSSAGPRDRSTPPFSSPPEVYSGLSGAGKPVVGDGAGGYRTGRDGVMYSGLAPAKPGWLPLGDKAKGTAVRDGLIPPLRPIWDIHLRDTIIQRAPDGTYYMTGSSGDNIWDRNDGVELWHSVDLQKWDYVGLVWSVDRDGTFQKRLRYVWAPEIHFINGKAVLALCMSGGTGGGTFLLKSTSGKPEGPYVNPLANDALTSGGIDATLFQDDDGRVYFANGGGGGIRLLKPDLSGFDGESHRVEMDRPADASWRQGQVAMEGVSIFKHEGKYYLTGAAFYHGRYSSVATISTNIFGPYHQWHEAVPCGGGGNYFQDVQGHWYCTYFGNDDQSPWREKPGLVQIDFAADGKISVADEQPVFVLTLGSPTRWRTPK